MSYQINFGHGLKTKIRVQQPLNTKFLYRASSTLSSLSDKPQTYLRYKTKNGLRPQHNISKPVFVISFQAMLLIMNTQQVGHSPVTFTPYFLRTFLSSTFLYTAFGGTGEKLTVLLPVCYTDRPTPKKGEQ